MKISRKNTIILSALALLTVCGTASATASTWKRIQPSSGMPMLMGVYNPTLQATLAEGQYFKINDGTSVYNTADAGTRWWRIVIPVENNEVTGEATTIRVKWNGYKTMAGTKMNGRVCTWNYQGFWTACAAPAAPPHDSWFSRSVDHYVSTSSTVAAQFEMGSTNVGGTQSILASVAYQQVD